MTYDWNPSIFKETNRRFREIWDDSIQVERKRRYVSQNHCLGILSQAYICNYDKERTLTSEMTESKISAAKNVHKKQRPEMIIRRPKIIGRSEEGGAMRAVLDSKARASAFFPKLEVFYPTFYFYWIEHGHSRPHMTHNLIPSAKDDCLAVIWVRRLMIQ